MWAFIAVATLVAAGAVSATSVPGQKPLHLNAVHQPKKHNDVAPRKLHGRFLHITDLHPDLNYKHGSDIDEKCHRGKGDAGHWGAEKSGCDTPWTLINETFKWIEENLKDQIDFVIWTGDSARHDNDVKIPRSDAEIYKLNKMAVDKMVDVFGNSSDPEIPMTVPVVPTLGNNDIYPHNIMMPGPSKLTREYVELWKEFIPQDQFHVFQKGAYFWQQVVPGKNGMMGPGSRGGLVAFSLNTLYFFGSNKAVDGCDTKSEPGYEQMEWLNIQLALMRERGSKVILMGHVPPAWTSAKMNWDESCWKKYVLWSRQYRDIIVGHFYGHMNLDHFMLLDSHELKPPHLKNSNKGKKSKKSDSGILAPRRRSLSGFDRCPAREVCHVEEFHPEANPKLSLSSAETYLNSLRKALKQMVAPKTEDEVSSFNKNADKFYERYVLAHVGPSIVPNYFPTLRVMEYNITGLANGKGMLNIDPDLEVDLQAGTEKAPKDEGMQPEPPSKSTPPGPAYSVQPFTLLSYTQYFLNLTKYNDIYKSQHDEKPHINYELRKRDTEIDQKNWKSRIQFEVEYDTKTDKVYKLKDLTVRSYIKLARNMVVPQEKKDKSSSKDLGTDTDFDEDIDTDTDEYTKDMKVKDDDGFDVDKNKKKRKHKKNKARSKVWRTFIKRAFVGAIDDDDLEQFEVKREECECT
ncbi:Metallo-dependent phosphatase-like protein [Trichophaea hybrida]|nr:Metallo-dependent phosphatase-like protein [Trichophaea hybrida]